MLLVLTAYSPSPETLGEGRRGIRKHKVFSRRAPLVGITNGGLSGEARMAKQEREGRDCRLKHTSMWLTNAVSRQ